jgi:hypothetical protein
MTGGEVVGMTVLVSKARLMKINLFRFVSFCLSLIYF